MTAIHNNHQLDEIIFQYDSIANNFTLPDDFEIFENNFDPLELLSEEGIQKLNEKAKTFETFVNQRNNMDPWEEILQDNLQLSAPAVGYASNDIFTTEVEPNSQAEKESKKIGENKEIFPVFEKQSLRTKNLQDAIVISLSFLGKATPAEIYKFIKNEGIYPKIGNKKAAQGKASITCAFNMDRQMKKVVTRKGHRKVIFEEKEKKLRMYDSESLKLEKGPPTRRIFLTPLGLSTSKILLGTEEKPTIAKSEMRFGDAISSILEHNIILTREEIEDIFYRERYCTYSKVWTNPNINGENPGDLINSFFRGSLGKYLLLCVDNKIINCYYNFYWLSKYGIEPLLEKLEQYNPWPERGTKLFRELMELRIKYRTSKNASEDKLKRISKLTTAFDMNNDPINLLVEPAKEFTIFEVKQSNIPGAGNGLFSLVDLPAATSVIVRGRVTKEDYNTTEFGRYKFSFDDWNGDKYVIDTVDENNVPTCAAAYINDSRDGHQQFVCEILHDNENKPLVFLKSMCHIPAGTEVYFAYGDSYWKSSSEKPNNLKYNLKRKDRDGNDEALSKRLKSIDIPLPIFENIIIELPSFV